MLETHETILPGKDQLQKIVDSKSLPGVTTAFDKYCRINGLGSLSFDMIFQAVSDSIVYPQGLKGYDLTEGIDANNRRLSSMFSNRMENLKRSKNKNVLELRDLVESEFGFMRFAKDHLILTNPGVFHEIYPLPSNIDRRALFWLDKEFGIKPGDELIQAHVVPGEDRDRLKKLGFNVPHDHWNKEYVLDGLKKTSKLLSRNPRIKGIFSRGSWIYDPDNYKPASDGRPFASFTFLSDDTLVGYRYSLGEAPQDSLQYDFAVSNYRRRRMSKTGEFKPKIVAAYYPGRELTQRFA